MIISSLVILCLQQQKVGNDTVLVLAPLAILPAFQKQGIGSALINKGHQIAKELGYEYCLVLGSEHYYPRFGYLPAEQFGIKVPKGIPSINFMAKKLIFRAGKISEVKYAKEFEYKNNSHLIVRVIFD